MSTVPDSVAALNFNVYRGDSFNHQIIWQDSDGEPIDLTGYTARMHVRIQLQGTKTVMEATDTNGLVLGGTAGTIDIQLSPSQTSISNLPHTHAPANVPHTHPCVYDLEVKSPVGFVTTLIKGLFNVETDVSRS